MIPYQWYSICFSVILKSSEEASATAIIDGKEFPLRLQGHREPHHFIDVDGDGILILGQDQDAFGSSFDPTESFSGYLSDFQFFNETLEKEAMMNWTKGYSTNFNKSPLITSNKIEDFQLNDIKIHPRCKFSMFFESVLPFYKFFTTEVIFEKAVLLCNGLGGELVAPSNEDENNKLFDFVSQTDIVCQGRHHSHDLVWFGIVPKLTNGTTEWVNYKTNEVLNYSKFHYGGQGSNDELSCVSFYGCKSKSLYWHRRWMKLSCISKREVLCRFDNFPFLEVRGFCSESRFDTVFYIDNSTANPNLIGLYSSNIVLIESNGSYPEHWRMTNSFGDLAILKVKDGQVKYITGRNKWEFLADRCEGDTHELVFTSCKHNQFTCSDGSCIAREKRCDYEINCIDGSDENLCDILVFPPTHYYTSIPPTKLPNKLNFEIEFCVEIQNIAYLSLETFKIDTDIKISLRWIDSQMKYANLRDLMNRNTISLTRPQIPWLPSIRVFGFNFSMSELTLNYDLLRVIKMSEPLPEDMSRLDEG